MKTLKLRVFTGRNVYTHHPAAQVLVDLEDLAGQESRDFAGFNTDLLHLLPGLLQHGCAGQQGGFARRLQEGTYFGHILEHIMLELQQQLGLPGKYGKTRATDHTGVYEVVFECYVPGLAELLVSIGMDIIDTLLQGRRFDLESALSALQQRLRKVDLGPSSKALVAAARARGISVHRIGDGSLLQLGTGCHARRLQATLTSNTSCIAADIAGDKSLTKSILEGAGIPVPRGQIVYSAEAAVTVWRQLQRPVVVKPCDGNQGRGVSLNLQTESDIVMAFAIAARFSQAVLVEEYIVGRHYRLLVVDGKMVAASERIPAHVVGNGQDTLADLIRQTNEDPLRGEEHEKPLTKLVVDDIVRTVVARQGYDMHSIVAAGSVVWLRENANLSTGGTAIDVTASVHPQLVALVVRAVRLVGLDVAGVDVVAQDIGAPCPQGSGVIIEINAAPGIRMHHYPTAGASRDVAAAIVESLFPAGTPSEIPVVAVTGTNGKTTTCRLVAHALRSCYATVGLTSTDGIYHNGELVVAGDTTGPWSTRVLLDDPAVEVAVLELARGGLLRGGLAFEQCDIALLTNVSEDHLGQDNLDSVEDLVWVKSLVLEAVRPDGYAVLNADDPHTEVLLAQQRSNVILFSRQADNILVRRHLGIGERAVFVRDGNIHLAAGATSESLLALQDVPITFGGRADYNVANALAASAVLWALGIDAAVIRKSLLTFLPDMRHNPGGKTCSRWQDSRC